ncbi:aldehyde dehydrogenase family protein [Polycyclovorans algicola]|uniref:aldehyde dehydrogenase family protein n=1 Tax=Polycyclovorans algicola TaxID=616992 RepID=UPI0005BB6835|nr:aldehyde dehydrogenase family protein [Polycyclovorans algicola]
MNDPLHTAPPLQPLFERLALKSHELVSTTAEQRAEKIRRLLKSVMDARPQILEAGRKELKLQDMDIDMQLLMVKTECEFVARNLGKWMGRHPVKGSLMSLGKKSYVQYEPKGVVLNLATWNAPIAIGLVPLLGAIAAGNTCVLKPSELAPLSAQVLAEIVAKAFPSDEFAVIQGGPEVASELLKLPFNHIFFIGGHAVGRLVMRAAAEHFASVTLEMGGKNPTIIDASADLADSARKIAWGRVANCGQVCLAPDYALVHESIQGPFVESLGKALHALYDASGEGFRQSPEVPRIVNRRHFDRIKALLDDALAKGATVAVGGQTDADDLFIAPTVLTGVTEDMRIMQEEIFGPILCVLPWQKRGEVIATIRKRPKPLGLYIFAKDREAIDWFLTHTTSGSTVVNHNLIQSGTNPHLPFGGVNSSGTGRIGGHFSFLECSNTRAVVEEGPPVGDPGLMFPPYSDKYKKMIGQMMGKEIKMPDAAIKAINGVIRVMGSLRGH